MENRIDAALRGSPPGLWPFLAAGYPDIATTCELLRAMAELPIRGVELGFPFSDPIADGPVIQAAFTHALTAGLRVDDIFDMVRTARRNGVAYPIVAMVSASIVYRRGVDLFVTRAAESGFDGLIVPDLSLEEAPTLSKACDKAHLRLCMLIAPTTPADRRRRIADAASGFLYYVSVQGVTGQRDALPVDLSAQVRQIKTTTGRPVLVGFGISQPAHVREVCSYADGAIVGSAIVRRMAEAHSTGVSRQELLRGTVDQVRSLTS
ncbi:MAG: tryptophan synthase subunit alpha [Planctomycetota bacterium]